MSTVTLKTGSSAVTLTGGTDVVYTKVQDTGKGFNLAVLTDAFKLRRFAKFSRTLPKINATAPGGYTQQRINGLVGIPMTLANGNVTNNTGSYALSYDPEATAAEKLELKLALVQTIMDTELEPLTVDGSISL